MKDFCKPVIGLGVFLGISSGAFAACPPERARYVIRDEQGLVAGFQARDVGGKGQLFFFVHTAKGDATQWFLPQGTHLVSTTDITAPGWRVGGPSPVGALDYSVTDEAGKVLPEFDVHAGAEAPAHILIPRLQ